MRNSQKRILKKRSGMTLIEITIAVVIIGIVSSYAFAQAAAYSDKAKYSRAVEDMAAITTALSISYLEHCDIWQPREGTGRTGSADGLDPIFTGENVTEHIGRKLSKSPENIKDPWDNPYIVEMMEDGDTMTAIVCCMNDDYDFSSGAAEESNGNNGNNGNGPGSNNGNHNGWENGNGGNNNGNGNGPGKDSGNHYGNGNGNGNGSNGDNESGSWGDGIRVNRYEGNMQMKSSVAIR
jgi:prepilin-type N-terminal cleavage/methylation domain-containing protein